MFDLVIINGKVVNGAGNPWFKADVAVSDGRIAEIGKLGGAEAERTIDADGLVVAPGFVDMHNHSDMSIMVNPRSESFIRQGATTLVFPNWDPVLRLLTRTLRRISRGIVRSFST